jgi:hypothetical protein
MRDTLAFVTTLLLASLVAPPAALLAQANKEPK